MIKQYDSISALMDEFDHAIAGVGGRYSRYARMNSSDGWYSNEDGAATIRKSRCGDTSLVKAAEEMLESLEGQLETPHRVVNRCVAGGWADVPAALTGSPLTMRRIDRAMAEHAPINIYVTTTSSAGVDHRTLMKRGTAILALVMAMSQTRPISLHTVACLDGSRDKTGETVVTARVNTGPLDLATACYVLTSSGFDRRVTHTVCDYINDFHGGWPRNYSYTNPQKYTDELTLRLGLDPRDTLFIKSTFLHDPIVQDPIAWIKEQMDRFTSREDEE